MGAFEMVCLSACLGVCLPVSPLLPPASSFYKINQWTQLATWVSSEGSHTQTHTHTIQQVESTHTQTFTVSPDGNRCVWPLPRALLCLIPGSQANSSANNRGWWPHLTCVCLCLCVCPLGVHRHQSQDLSGYYSLPPGGVGQITPSMSWWVSRAHTHVHGQTCTCWDPASHGVNSFWPLLLAITWRHSSIKGRKLLIADWGSFLVIK